MELPYVFAMNINGTDQNSIVKIENGSAPKVICLCEKEQANEIINAFSKSISWDNLDTEISKYYKEEELPEDAEDDMDGLIGIGELAATAFGYL